MRGLPRATLLFIGTSAPNYSQLRCKNQFGSLIGTPMPMPVPRTLDAWVKQLSHIRLSLEQRQHQRLKQILQDERSSWGDISAEIEQAPSFALAVIRAANRVDGQPLQSCEAALARLGIKRCEELLAKTPALAENERCEALRRLQQLSLHARHQSHGLFSARLARLRGELDSATLLFFSPLWALGQAFPELLEQWEQRVVGNGEPVSRVEAQLLGVPLVDLCLAMAEYWRLPTWIISGYRLLKQDRRRVAKALLIARDNEHPIHQQQMLDADPELRQWLTHPGNCVMLANSVAASVQHGWGSPECLRWLSLSGLYLQVPLAQVLQTSHQLAVSSARQLDGSGLWHPAQALIWPWQQAHALWQVQLVQPGSLAHWRTCCEELVRDPSPFSNVLQLTDCVAQALHAAGMRRVLVLVSDRQQAYLKTQQIVGLDKGAEQLVLATANSRVLQKLMSAPAQLRLTPDNAAQFSALLPGALKALFASEHVLLRSVANNGRVVMVLVADQQGQPLGELALRAFAKTGECVQRALGNFAKRGR